MAYNILALCAYALGIGLAYTALALTVVSDALNSAAEACVRRVERLGTYARRMPRS